MDFATLHKITALLWMNRTEEAEPIANALLSSNAANTIKSSLYGMKSNMCVQKGDTNGAIEFALLSYEMRRDIIRPVDEMTYNEKMYKLYARIENYQEAFRYLELFHARKLLLANESNMATMADMQAKYDNEKKELELKEIKLQQAESELKALKAQMNPHFIFNSLNSIQEIFFLGDKQLANEHLSRFSQLMRNILKASGRKMVTLHEEIQMLEEYLALEALRFGESFSYSISHDENVSIYTLDVPPMIIQPFAENAVKHGLQHKKGNKTLSIHFSFDETQSIITSVVADNGIGRAASEAINKKRVAHQSFATSATSRRFEVLNSNSAQKFNYHYVDTVNSQGMPAGTEVHITMPVED